LLDKDREADIGGTPMDRARAQAVIDIRRMSEGGSSMTREGALEEINKSRVAEGKAPLRIDFKDVAAVDKAEADTLRKKESDFDEAIRDLAGPGRPKPFVPSAEAQQKQAEARYNLARMREERDAPDFVSASTPKTNKETPRGGDRTLVGDLISAEEALYRGVKAGVNKAIEAEEAVGRVADRAIRSGDRATTGFINYAMRKPGEAKILTAEELRRRRRNTPPTR
jgi:hypothetical protein